MPAAGSLSARGVAGEASRDGLVPNLNIFGQQHHRTPFKDKSRFANVPERPEWTRQPRHHTRTELFNARRAAKHADLSYDIDGDGAVGPTDYFIGKQFSREQDHRLNTSEREQVVRALEEGWLDKYSFGHEQAGAKRAFPVYQARGKIITVDNAHELNEVYPAHWNAHKNPPHKTGTDLAHHRKAELTNAADTLKNEWDKKHPMFVKEPAVPRDPTPREYGRGASVRREARRREARAAAGLEEEITYVNPHREEQQPGLDYRHRPPHGTRTILREARKAQMREDLQRNRLEAETDYVPKVARHTWRDAEEYDDRRPDPEALTHTKLKQMRKEEDIEHNMRNFKLQEVEYPRFSETEEPWWTRQKGYVHEPAQCLLKDIKDPPKDREITGKPTEICHTRARVRDTPPSASGGSKASDGQVAVEFDSLHDTTIRRWTTEFVPPTLAEKAPRYFDGVKQAPTYSTDTLNIQQFSSFDCIAKDALRKDVERQIRVAAEDEERAHSWKLNTRGLPDPNTGAPGVQGRGLPESVRSLSSRASDPPGQSAPARYTEVVRTQIQSSTPMPAPTGEDPPMQDRLDRLVDKAPVSPRMAPISEVGSRLETPLSYAPVTKATESPPKRLGSQRPSVGSKLGTESGRGSRADKSSPVDVCPPAPRLVVRSSGFQWVNRHAPPLMAEDGIGVSRSISKSTLLQETPPRSRSVSRTNHSSVAAMVG